MKYSKKIRGMSTALAFAFTFMVFSFSFAPKAYAAESNISVTYGIAWYGDNTIQNTFSVFETKSGTTPISNGQVGQRYTASGALHKYSIGPYIVTAGNVWHSGPAKLYFSVYPEGGTPVGDLGDLDAYQLWYDNSGGNRISFIGADDITEYPVDTSSTGKGYMVECRWQGSEGFPITRLAVNNVFGNGIDVITTGSGYYTIRMVYPSIRLVTSESSAELDALDSVADELAQQSDLLLAMKGDIVAILQDIYTMTGDMYIAQNLLNTYIAQMLPLLESIDQTTTNIYALLGSQLAALETAINTSASTIEAAIEAQTAAMIAYLEEMFNTGNEVPSETYEQQQDAENILDQMESLEKPDVETIVPDIGDIGNDDMSGALNSIFSSNLIVTMMTLSASLAFGAYVLFGKRG